MVTSGSADAAQWIARAEMYTGRSDPSWPLAAQDVAALDRLWRAMGPFAGPLPRPPPLGYRGCHVSRGDVDYFAFGDVVTRIAGASVEARADIDGAYEQRVLASAPAATIPSGLMRK